MKAFKNLLCVLLVVIFAFILVGCGKCTEHVDEDNNQICDKCGETIEIPECKEHKDDDKNYVCDVCGEKLEVPECAEHTDENEDYVCDVCEKKLEKPEPVIIVPPYKDYERGTIDFANIVYARPSYESTIAEFEELCDLIEANTATYDEQLDAIYALEDDYTEILSMYSLLEVYTSIDASNEEWAAEYEYMSTNYPSLSQAIENLYVSAANSPHAEKFEVDYFGEDLIEEYKDGGIYTDTLVELMASEADLTSEYSALSTATVVVEFKGMTDTVDNILKYYEETYGLDSTEYKGASNATTFLYEAAMEKRSREILVELFKVRRLIADELGHDSYSTYGYETIYHDYTEEQMLDFLTSVSANILPVYVELAYNTDKFAPYLNGNAQLQSVNTGTLVNNTYNILADIDPELQEMFAYMLQHKLYDIAPSKENRLDGAFTTYIEKYNAPFIFMSTGKDAMDYMTLFHEFGHFADNYINDHSSTSLDLSEVSSQALEYIAVTRLSNVLDRNSIKYLKTAKLAETCEILLYQGFYSLFEHYAYEIPYDEISEASLNEAVVRAANKMGLNTEMVNTIDYVMIPHIVEYPFYVQSYCTSAVAAISIFEMEENEAGTGLEAYLKLLDRGENELTFEEYLTNAGIESPFADNRIRELANFIHRYMTGENYFGS